MAGSAARCGLMVFWILAVLLVNFANSTEYLAEECGEVIDIGNSGGILDSQLGLNYESDLDCTVTLRATSGRRILLAFDRFETEGYSPCSTDYLELFDSDMSSLGKLCGENLPEHVTSLNNELTLRFRTDNSISETGFFLAYTSFSSGICDSIEFSCDNSRCIDADLTYNAYDNCGDNSDEGYTTDIDFGDTFNTAAGILRWGIGVLIAIIIGIIALVVLVCVCVGCICFHVCCKSSPPQRTNAVVLTSASPQPSGQAQYNQPPPAYNQSAPYGQPTTAPYGQPTEAPYGKPTEAPYGQPTTAPYGQPTTAPYGQPTTAPYGQPTTAPYGQPTTAPYGQPTTAPYGQPTGEQPATLDTKA